MPAQASLNGDPVNLTDPDGHRPACDTPAECKSVNAWWAKAQMAGARQAARDQARAVQAQAAKDFELLLWALEGTGIAAERARESVSNAARVLASKLSDPEAKAAASWLLRNFGSKTRFVDSPFFKASARGLAVLDFASLAAEYSLEHKSVLEVSTRTVVEGGGGLLGGFGGGWVGGLIGAGGCALFGLETAGAGCAASIAIGTGVGAAGGSIGGSYLAKKVITDPLFDKDLKGVSFDWEYVPGPNDPRPTPQPGSSPYSQPDSGSGQSWTPQPQPETAPQP